MTSGIVVIGLGNPYRRDDGVGLVVAAAVAALSLDAVTVATGIEDPMTLVDAWTGMALAVVVDAAVTALPTAGLVRSCTVAELSETALSSHDVDVSAALAFGRAVDRVPGELVVVTVGVADTGYGAGLTPEVAAAVPRATAAVLTEIARVTGAAGFLLGR